MHVAPIATANGELEVYGAPYTSTLPRSVVPSEQMRLQLTCQYDPAEQVIAEELVGGAEGTAPKELVGGEGEGGSGGDGEGGGDGQLPGPQLSP